MIHMALDLSKLTRNVDELGDAVAKRITDINESLPVARATLTSLTNEAEQLIKRAERVARHFRWAGAIPTDEKMDAAFPLPSRPQRFNVIAADGSQIYPDRHGVATYYLINVGSIVFRYGIPDAPSINTRPEVFFKDEDLYYEEEGSLMTTEMINAMRDVRELGELAQLLKVESAAAPSLALLDNGLLLYITLREHDPQFSDEVISEYLASLDSIKESDSMVAGVVERPRSANVVRLLNLAKLSDEEITPETLRGVGKQFRHITDGALFDFLKPGERSALFVLASPANLERYEPAHHKIYFFFLNAGRDGKDSILRVEVPEWIAQDKTKLEVVHAGIVAQCKMSDGFPYVLMRAHEMAVVTAKEHHEVDNMVATSLLRHKIKPSISQKSQGKQWTGSSKRRYGR